MSKVGNWGAGKMAQGTVEHDVLSLIPQKTTPTNCPPPLKDTHAHPKQINKKYLQTEFQNIQRSYVIIKLDSFQEYNTI